MKLSVIMKKTIFNVFAYKCVLIIFLIPTLLVPAVSFNYKLLFVMLAWGAVLCLYDLMREHKFMHASGMIWLIGFLISFLIAVLLNFKNNFGGNLSIFGYTVIALVLLYPDHTKSDQNRILHELFILNSIFISITAMLSTISLYMFACKFSEIVMIDGRKFVIGWHSNRLYGLYKNMGYMTSAIGLALIMMQFTVMRARSDSNRWYKAFLIYTAIVNFCSMCMENATGAFISLAVYIALLGFFISMRRLSTRNWRQGRVIVASVAIMLLLVALFFGSISASRTVLSYVPGMYDLLSSDVVEGSPDTPIKDIVQEEIDREIPDNYGALTGRPKIWKFGIEQFLEKPLFGYGANSHSNSKVLEAGLAHFHNLVIQSLVSVGIIGSIFIATFFIRRLLILLIAVWKRVSEQSAYIPVCISLISLMGMFMINSMSEVTVLFQARFSMFLFWIMLGYLTTLLGYEKRSEDKLMEKASDSVNAMLIKANKNAK